MREGLTYSNKHCPDCGYFVSKHTLPGWEGVYHCYNCDEDLTEEEIVMTVHTPVHRGDDDEGWATTTFDAEIVSTNDGQSLADALKEGNFTVQTSPVTTPGTSAALFPYTLEDLLYWVVKRTTGEIVKYQLVDTPGIPGHKSEKEVKALSIVPKAGSTSTPVQTGFSDWCNHHPAKEPVWEYAPEEGSPYPYQRLFIADAAGMRNHKEEFDIVLDCGDVLSDYYALRGQSLLIGAKSLTEGLEEHIIGQTDSPKVLKITWADRKAPFLHPSFWPALAQRLEGDVLINCVGGHGRSGTALVCLMMALNPDYDAYDAIVHLRAMHCPRAIESFEQHEYINLVATFLNRKANAKDIHTIQSYKAAFLAIKKESAAPYQARFGGV